MQNSKAPATAFDSLAEAYAWLDNHINYERNLGRVSYDDRTFELEAFARRLERLGNPHKGLRPIHVAGTRGKGSAALALEKLLQASGCRTAVFTSPHIHEYRERVRVGGRPLAQETTVRLLTRIARLHREAADSPPQAFKTVFENLTALFFLASREAEVDWAIVETGLGGRLDATNVLDPGPVLLTRIGLEHTHLLGTTIEAIAGEKAAILKPGGWGVLGAQPDDAERVFSRRARSVQSPLFRAEDLCPVVEVRPHPDGLAAVFQFEGDRFEIETRLYGPFQAENLQNALAMISRLRVEALIPAATPARLTAALTGFVLPGRMERLGGEPQWFADAGHCPTAARALAETMATHFGDEPADLVIGMVEDKDYQGFLRELARWPGWRRIYCYAPESPRALDPERLGAAARQFFDPVFVQADLRAALEIMSKSDEKTRRAVASGTIYSIATLENWIQTATHGIEPQPQIQR